MRLPGPESRPKAAPLATKRRHGLGRNAQGLEPGGLRGRGRPGRRRARIEGDRAAENPERPEDAPEIVAGEFARRLEREPHARHGLRVGSLIASTTPRPRGSAVERGARPRTRCRTPGVPAEAANAAARNAQPAQTQPEVAAGSRPTPARRKPTVAVGRNVTPAARTAIARPEPTPPVAQPRPRMTAAARQQPIRPLTRPRRCARRTSGTAANGKPERSDDGKDEEGRKGRRRSESRHGNLETAERRRCGRLSVGNVHVALASRGVPRSGDDTPRPDAELVRGVRQQRDRTRALDRRLQLALVEGAGARDPPRKDLPALGDEALEELDVLPVDVLELLRAELADLAAANEELLPRSALGILAGRAAPARPGRPEPPPILMARSFRRAPPEPPPSLRSEARADAADA